MEWLYVAEVPIYTLLRYAQDKHHKAPNYHQKIFPETTKVIKRIGVDSDHCLLT